MTGKLLFGLQIPAVITATLVQEMLDLIHDQEYTCHALECTRTYMDSDDQPSINAGWDELLRVTGIGTSGGGFRYDDPDIDENPLGRDPDITALLQQHGAYGFKADIERRKIFLRKLIEVLSE